MASTNKFFWYELMTSDHAAAQVFYEKVVGWRLKPFPADGHPYTVLEAEGRGIGGIMPIPPEAAANGMQPCWVGYLHVADLDEAVAGLRAAGGVVHHILDPIPHVGRIAVVADPQGAMFNLLQPDGPDMQPLPPCTIGTVGWHELHGKDWETAFDFYSARFGWSKSGSMDMGAMGVYQFFAMEPAPEGAECSATIGAMYNDPQAPRAYWLFYIHVDAIDAAIDRITAHCGTILVGPQEVPGGTWIVNAQDPQGAVFALVAPKR